MSRIGDAGRSTASASTGKLMENPLVVAGATGGMGRAIVMSQLAQGQPVIALGRSETALSELASLVEDAPCGASLTTRKLDICDAAACEEFVASLAKTETGISGYVHAAGMGCFGSIEATQDQDWRSAFEIKVTAAARMIRLLLGQMRKAEAARILLIGGVFAKQPSGLFTINSTLNSAVSGLGKALADTLRPDGIRVNVLHPGATETSQWRDLASAAGRAFGMSADAITEATAAQLIGNRLLDPAEIAGAASYLLSKENGRMTGTQLVFDAGETRAV